MIIIDHIVGNTQDPHWRTRLADAEIDWLMLDQWEAQKSRLRKATAQDVELALSLDRNTHLHDGDILPISTLLAAIGEIARVIKVPLTADIEGGYSDDLAMVADTIKGVIGAGAVGINFEDGGRDPELHVRKIETARKAADETGVALFVNARIDVYLRGLAQGEAAHDSQEVADVEGHDRQHEQVGGRHVCGVQQAEEEPDHQRAEAELPAGRPFLGGVHRLAVLTGKCTVRRGASIFPSCKEVFWT